MNSITAVSIIVGLMVRNVMQVLREIISLYGSLEIRMVHFCTKSNWGIGKNHKSYFSILKAWLQPKVIFHLLLVTSKVKRNPSFKSGAKYWLVTTVIRIIYFFII